MITEDQVRKQLEKVIDPELQLDIVSMGLVYEIKIKKGGENVFILMTLTSPGCPLAGVFEKMVIDAVKKLKEVVEVDVELTFDPPWNQEMMSEEAKAELGFF